ncbi:MAG: Flp pilus assembly protein CpaB [Zoogloeaceae bacterium]|jgi:pilus assembly protein CpaB|nr:Flp pilus assembly protein CpaB [Zoogloeaceae bacterium]
MTSGIRRLILLGLAIGMAVLAAFLVKVYLDQRAAELEARYADHTEKAAVVVARNNVPVNNRVIVDDFAIRQMPVDMIPPDAVAPGDIDRALGQSLKINLPVGRPLLWTYLSSGANPSFSDMLDENRRALTIAVDELNSISGMVRPYDRIDLFVIRKENRGIPGVKENKVVMPLLQDVLVKATGNIVRRETTVDGREFDRRYSTLTLDLLPDEIGMVLIAQENGELKAALKRSEQSAAAYRPTRENDLWPSGSEDESGVAFYVGGRATGVLRSEIHPYPSGIVTGANGATGDGQSNPPDGIEGLIEHQAEQDSGMDAANVPARNSAAGVTANAAKIKRRAK